MKQQENNRMCTTGSPPEGYNYTYAGGCENSTETIDHNSMYLPVFGLSVAACCQMRQYLHNCVAQLILCYAGIR